MTAERLTENREKIETATPPIHPLVLPNRLFEDRLDLKLGQRTVELHHFAIHSADGNVLWLPEEKLLLAGDTVEDCATFIAEAEHVATHIAELKRLRLLPIARILPSHGDRDRIAEGGYDGALIDANRSYLERLIKAAASETPIGPLKDFAADEIAAGAILYFAPYEDVHDSNVARMRAAAKTT
ncbi:hypothetical protein D3C72_1434040 [compost metagenome]